MTLNNDAVISGKKYRILNYMITGVNEITEALHPAPQNLLSMTSGDFEIPESPHG